MDQYAEITSRYIIHKLRVITVGLYDEQALQEAAYCAVGEFNVVPLAFSFSRWVRQDPNDRAPLASLVVSVRPNEQHLLPVPQRGNII
jgi:hypothetical protein